MWNRLKGGPNFDFIWFNVHPSVAAFAANTTAFAAASEMDGVGERFDAIADCETNVSTVHPVFQGANVSEDDDGGNVLIASNACMLNSGVSEADIVDLENHIRGVLGTIDEYANATVWMANPITNSPTGADAYLFVVHESLTSWAAASDGFQASPGRDSLVRHFNATMNCSSAMWTAEQVIGN